MRIDLNCDMGELPELADDGTQDRLMQYVSSVNVSCGAHAGDEALIERTIRSARAHGVAIGAHPGYPDRENFGRVAKLMNDAALVRCIEDQLSTFTGIAQRCGASISHVKPHGALYNLAARDVHTATAICRAIGDLPLYVLAGSPQEELCRMRGVAVVAEAFADRRYERDGSLRARHQSDALITDPDEAARQAIEIAKGGRVQTICIHSDTAGAATIAERVRSALEHAGIAVAPPFNPLRRS